MDVRTYRAKSMQEALALVRHELGPEASVLHTREVRDWKSWLGGQRRIEVTASASVRVPSRLRQPANSPAAATSGIARPQLPDYDDPIEQPFEQPEFEDGGASVDRLAELEPGDAFEASAASDLAEPMESLETGSESSAIRPAHEDDYRAKFRNDLKGQIDNLHSMLEELSQRQQKQELPESLFHLFTDLIDAELSEELARELLHRVRTSADGSDLDDPMVLKSRVARLLESELTTQGPIEVKPGQRRMVALVGPTGVGKTTTIAKLAANFHLRDQRRVGLITVDTYRIAAVEQLRTYADIIDLPMEVVSTPREMRRAVERFQDLDLVLLDTAGRSPRDEIQLQELRTILQEAQPDEVHLVLSSVASESSLKKTAERFKKVGTTALMMTKLDEATGLGSLIPLCRSCQLPLSYVTHGQTVPDDIEAAERRKLVRHMLAPAEEH